jgi:hypothetical protein
MYRKDEATVSAPETTNVFNMHNLLTMATFETDSADFADDAIRHKKLTVTCILQLQS